MAYPFLTLIGLDMHWKLCVQSRSVHAGKQLKNSEEAYCKLQTTMF